MSRHDGSALSTREREIANLVSEGITNLEIAGRLFISERTVESHVKSILTKLGLRNRTQIATWTTRSPMEERDSEHAPMPDTVRPPTNLPVQLTTFVGRQRDLADTRQMLQKVRILTITGPGGCGKTRLAIQLADEVRHRYPSGVWFVDLSLVNEPNQVARRIAAALGIRELPGTDPLDAIAAELAVSRRRRQALVVLDNCEHLRAACAKIVDTLMRANSDMSFVCTSREPLHVSSEAIWRLDTLPVPPLDSPLSPQRVRRSEAVQLLLDRIGLKDPKFELNRANAIEITRLCRELDGIPLALELAAPLVGMMSLGHVVNHLTERIRSLSAYGAPSRHQTVRSTIGWSYDLLAESERQLLRRLSVFSGGFTFEAAQMVSGSDARLSDHAILELLTILVDKSLIVRVPRRDRYRCPELIRRFAFAHLTESGELDTVRRRHFELFSDLVDQARDGLVGPAQATWLERLTDDYDNMRLALEYSRGESVEQRLRMVLGLNRFWHACGRVPEGREWTDEALGALEKSPSTVLHARVLNSAASLAMAQRDYVRAQEYLLESLTTCRAVGDRPGCQICLASLGINSMIQGSWQAACDSFAESLALARELQDRRATGLVLGNLGLVMACLGQHGTAISYLTESLEAMRALGDTVRVGLISTNLGTASLYGRRYEAAAGWFSESLRVMRSLGARQDLAESLEGMAMIEAELGRPERALHLAGAAAGVRESIEAPHMPWSRRLLDDWIGGARDALGSRAAQVWEEGEEMDMQEAIEMALGETDPSRSST